VLAADTLVYLGDLKPAMRGVARVLKPDGFFLFTTEKKEGEGFELGPKRRWRHSQTYLRALACKHGLEIAGLLSCTPRMEANMPVEGLAVALRKPV
jgi:predicted TPR repeat methyltransferase